MKVIDLPLKYEDGTSPKVLMFSLRENTKHESYICEKLFNGRMDYSVSEVAKLINGVIEKMNNG